jgi:hypothetical protein
MLHFMDSVTSGQASWINSRMRVRMGCAKGLAFSMYASTLGLKLSALMDCDLLSAGFLSPCIITGAQEFVHRVTSIRQTVFAERRSLVDLKAAASG